MNIPTGGGAIPQIIKNKIVGEANWRSTNGHGGVDDITRDNFIQAAEYGFLLAQPNPEAIQQQGKEGRDETWDEFANHYAYIATKEPGITLPEVIEYFQKYFIIHLK